MCSVTTSTWGHFPACKSCKIGLSRRLPMLVGHLLGSDRTEFALSPEAEGTGGCFPFRFHPRGGRNVRGRLSFRLLRVPAVGSPPSHQPLTSVRLSRRGRRVLTDIHRRSPSGHAGRRGFARRRSLRWTSSPSSLGEGDRSKSGGGAGTSGSMLLHQLRWSPSPRQAGGGIWEY